MDADCQLVDQLLSAQLTRHATRLDPHSQPADHLTEGRLSPLFLPVAESTRGCGLCETSMVGVYVGWITLLRLDITKQVNKMRRLKSWALEMYDPTQTGL